ncbi:metal ABC transporter substrate-binding protein [Ferrovibrio xuzhouensis]|uniref:Metal ABC transporter substrate-binding protein n=1 Tax=Ferrovibrio xuzhouensis TaxID=1576914 RepID=A0ABV7VDA1_9PROT
MRLSLRHLCAAGLLAVAATAASPALAAPRQVVATFSVLGDMVKEIGGNDVHVITLVPPGGDAHVYQPKPGDAKNIARADLVVVNGLGMEGWIDRLISASGYKGRIATASTGVKPQTMSEDDDDDHDSKAAAKDDGKPHIVTDPHAWQNVANGAIYIRNIATALNAIDPAHAADYEARTTAYLAGLKDLDAWVKTQIATVPEAKRRIITSHDAFGYFGSAYGISFLAPLGISTDADPSAAHVGQLIKQMRAEHIKALFIENMTDPRLVQQLAREAHAAVGGTLYSDSLSKAGGPADTYVKMFRNNVPEMVAAMQKN